MVRYLIYFIFIIFTVIFGGGVLFYIFEAPINAGVSSLPDGLWLAVGTITLLGYGDIYPITWAGRLVAVFLMFFGISLISLSTVLISRYILEKWLAERGHKITIKTDQDPDLNDAIEDLKHLSHLDKKRLAELEKKFETMFDKKTIKQ